MKKQISCGHKEKIVFTYSLIGCDLIVCEKCNKKLIEEIEDQNEMECMLE